MYRDDRAMSDGMECLLEETLDKMQHPLTLYGTGATLSAFNSGQLW